tara:strand:- start:10887 stop:11213 length:327 start_codon:yes stop_codon:yes gene_type:complete
MARCFITQLPTVKHDLQILARFGAITPLLGRGYYPDDVQMYTHEILASCDKSLIEFNPEVDYIVPLGDSCVVSTITIWLERNGYLPATFLKYDKKLRGYYEIKIGEKI